MVNHMQQIDFTSVPPNIDAKIEKLTKAIDFVSNFKKSSKIIESQSTHEAFQLIEKVIHSKDFNEWSLFTNKNCEELFGQIIHYYYKADIKKIESSVETSELNKRRIDIFICLLSILNKLFISSVNFNRKFCDTIGLNALLLILNDDKLLESAAENEEILDILHAITSNLNLLSRFCENTKPKWLGLNAIEILLKVSKIKNLKIIAYSAIINISDDKQIEMLNELHSAAEYFVEGVNICKMDFEGKHFKRSNVELVENDELKIFKVHFVHSMNLGKYSITGILLALYRLAVNDRMKLDIYEQFKIKQPLKIVIMKGNEIEARYALKLLAQLCFNEKILTDVYSDEPLRNHIEQLKTDDKVTLVELKKVCQEILWLFQAFLPIEIAETQELSATTTTIQNNQVMISYNTKSRDLCLRIKSELESSAKLKVWIDVNEMHGSSLDSMSKAVEESFCILMCVTEYYRQSIYCQAEAQYAFRLKKPIIPLIMQENYENVKGWLGIIIGDRIFVNFTKYQFEDCMRRLKNEIVSLKATTRPKLNKIDSSINLSSKSSSDLNMNSIVKTDRKIIEIIRKWTQIEVEKWLEENCLNSEIKYSLSNLNGEDLYQLYCIKSEAPEFFYQSIKANHQIDLKTIISFTSNLKKLFESS